MSTTLTTSSHGRSTPASPPGSPPASPPGDAGGGSRALRLHAVLATGLPDELGTADAPALYTVPVVFSRQVSSAEQARIEDPETARRLVDVTGADPGLALVVEDRRLLIQNTNLRTLKDGLAAAVGQMLQQLGRDLVAEQDRLTAATELRQAGERERAEAVAREAAEISFAADDEPAQVAGGAVTT